MRTTPIFYGISRVLRSVHNVFITMEAVPSTLRQVWLVNAVCTVRAETTREWDVLCTVDLGCIRRRREWYKSLRMTREEMIIAAKRQIWHKTHGAVYIFSAWPCETHCWMLCAPWYFHCGEVMERKWFSVESSQVPNCILTIEPWTRHENCLKVLDDAARMSHTHTHTDETREKTYKTTKTRLLLCRVSLDVA